MALDLAKQEGNLPFPFYQEQQLVDLGAAFLRTAVSIPVLSSHACREKLFELINEHPTCFEVVSGKARMEKKPLPLKRGLPPSSRSLGPAKAYRPVSFSLEYIAYGGICDMHKLDIAYQYAVSVCHHASYQRRSWASTKHAELPAWCWWGGGWWRWWWSWWRLCWWGGRPMSKLWPCIQVIMRIAYIDAGYFSTISMWTETPSQNKMKQLFADGRQSIHLHGLASLSKLQHAMSEVFCSCTDTLWRTEYLPGLRFL